MSKPNIRTQWDRKRVYAIHSDEMLTEQSHEKACDMHYVLRQYTNYGQLPIGNTRGTPQFMDCPDQDNDYKNIMDTLKRAESEFYRLPLEEQQKHGNNPSEWLRGVLSDDFIDNPDDTEANAEGAEGTSEASPEVVQNEGANPPDEG